MLTAQITYGNFLRILVIGFTLVIVLLAAAAFIGVSNVRSIKKDAAALVAGQSRTTGLIEEIQREQGTLNAIFYKLARSSGDFDAETILGQLNQADQAIARIVASARGTPEDHIWQRLEAVTGAFSVEARRLLALKDVPSRSSRDLFRRHEEVTTLVASLIAAGQEKAQGARDRIEQRSTHLVTESAVLLGASLVLALLSAIFTVRMTAGLFRRMEWQTGELSRVSWNMLEKQETTARRFSHELHDELGQSLAAVKANLQALGSSERVEDCNRLVDEAIRNVRELSQLLRPTILDDFGLDASLRWLAEGFAQRTRIEVDYQSGFNERMRDEIETHLFRIAQEALTNVARHSGAGRVTMRLEADGSRVHLSIHDNGRGIANGKPGSGMGMIGMRARAREAGGELKIESAPGSGVRVDVWSGKA